VRNTCVNNVYTQGEIGEQDTPGNNHEQIYEKNYKGLQNMERDRK